MKRAFLLFCGIAIAAAAGFPACTSAPGPSSKTRVIVVGIDGGTWTMIEPMMAAGELPNLKKLYDRGLHGILESRPPIISPVVWTTIFTGFGHAKHGVRDWKTSQSVNRKVSAIWEILRGKKKVDVFNVPATWPPDPIDGAMLSGFPLSGATHAGNTGEVVTREKLDSGKLPTAYRDSAAAIRDNAYNLEVGKWSGWFPGKIASRPTFQGVLRAYRLGQDQWYLTPLYRVDEGLVISEPKTLRADVQKKIGEPYIPEGPGWSRWEEGHTPEVLYDHLDQVFEIQSNAALEFAGGDWDLFLYVMTFVDRVSHPYWGYGHAQDFPDMDPEKAKRYGDAVANAYRRSDEELGLLLEKAGGDPYVVVVSDHGFQSSTDKTKAIGTHNPAGIYLVAGPGITAKEGVPTFIEDVTPTLLYLMGEPVGQDMDGKIFADVVDMIGRKPTSIPSWETVVREATDEPVDGDTWESLRGLGYVDGAAPRDEKKKAAGDDAGAAGAAKGAGAGAGTHKAAGDKPGATPGGTPKAPAGGAASEPGAAAEPGAAPAPNGKPAAKAPAHDALDDWPEAPSPDDAADPHAH